MLKDLIEDLEIINNNLKYLPNIMSEESAYHTSSDVSEHLLNKQRYELEDVIRGLKILLQKEEKEKQNENSNTN